MSRTDTFDTYRALGDVESGISNVSNIRENPDESDEPYFLLAFKACVEENDHWINKLAVWGTSHEINNNLHPVFFNGKMSHVEILIKKENVWRRYSIMKTRGVIRKGMVVWEPGKVHGIVTEYETVKNYRFYKIRVASKHAMSKALHFLENEIQKGAGFNMPGYVLNFIFPFKVGISNYKQAQLRKKNTWFCTELVICAM